MTGVYGIPHSSERQKEENCSIENARFARAKSRVVIQIYLVEILSEIASHQNTSPTEKVIRGKAPVNGYGPLHA